MRLFVFILLTWLLATVGFQTWRRDEVLRYDVSSYYSYLPGAFIHHDLSFQWMKKEDRFYRWFEVLPDGRRHQRMTMGMAILYLPLFTVGQLAAMAGGFPTDGYSMPYSAALCLCGLLYAGIGFWRLRLLLLRWFPAGTVNWVLLTIGLGTNLFYYVTMAGAYSHAASFALLILLLEASLNWIEQPRNSTALWVGILVGLISLIRPVNMMAVIVPLALIYNALKNNQIERHQVLRSILLTMLSAVVVWLPQLFYWKYATGQWLFYSYAGERFYFTQPHLWEVLFSFRKGWLVYTPVMLLSVGGLWQLRRYVPSLTIALPVWLTVHVYLMSCWWIWWYGGSFGMRPMVDTYGWLAIPLAALLERVGERGRWFDRSVKGLMICCIALNLFQTVQMRLGVLHWDSMTAAAYQKTFLQLHKVPDLEQYLDHPDLGKAYYGQ